MTEHDHSPTHDRASHVEDLINAIGGVIWEYDWTSERYTFVSIAAEQLLGYPAEAWLEPRFWTRHVHPEDLVWVRALSDQMTRQLEQHEITYRMLHREGSVVWVRDVITPRREADGRVLQRGMLVDISAQRIAELAAQRAETGFREMVEAGGRIAMKIDMVGRFTYVSSALCELVGKSETELLGTPFTQLLEGDERRRIMFAHRDHMSGREVQRSFQVHLRNPKGERRIIALQTATLYDRNGRPSGATAMGEDVTDGMAMRRELERRADEFDTVFRLLGDTYVRIDESGIIRDIKAVSDEAFVGTVSQARGRHASEVFPPDMAEEMRLGAVRAHASGERAIVEYQLAGEAGPSEFEARLLPLSDDASAMVIRNVDERVRRERELAESIDFLERLLGLIDSGVLVISGQDQAVLRANTPAEWILGYEHDELVGLPASQLYPDTHDRRGLLERVAAAVEEQGAYHGEAEFSRRDGSRFSAEVSVRPIDLDGRQYLVVMRDVTERRQIEERERQYHERLSALSADLIGAEDRERRRLAEELHDRVSQAMAVARIHLVASLDDDSRARSEAREALGLLDEAIREARAITSELSPPVLYELGLGPALEWLADRMREQHGLDVVTTVSEEAEPGDELSAFFFRTARELLVNAVKHARATKVWLSLDRAADRLVLTVEDDGVGFASEESGEGDVGGGFGLFSVRERTRQLAGTIDVESEPGKGTRITVSLPV